MEYLQNVKKWREYKDLDASLKSELESLSGEKLEDAFYTDLAFGTGGMRGVMGVGTNRMNIYTIQKATYGFYLYMNEEYEDLKERGVVISYDCRNNSFEFAKRSAMVLGANGVKTYLFSSLRPTPELSFAVRHLGCCGGIMVTASHNPPEYNGYKVYDHLGCQLVPELADKAIARINGIEDLFQVPLRDFDELVSEGLVVMIDKEVDEAYLEQVKTVKFQEVDKKNIKIVFTPLHGTASVSLVDLLTEVGYNVIPVKEQMIPDGNFTTVASPNPENASAFEKALELGKKEKADILIATDPDADRMGIAAIDPKTGEYVLLTGNQTGAILLDYLAKFRKHEKNANVYNTIVSSNIAAAICAKHNLNLVQTLTGFKFIGEQAMLIENTDQEFFFGYEESYGYVIKDFVRDKDSLQATLLLSEVASYYKSLNKTLVEVLDDIYAEYGYYAEGVENIYLTGLDGSKKIEKIMRTFQGMRISEIAGRKVTIIEDYDQGIKYENNKKSRLTLPKSFVLKYIFEDGGWFVLRPSGTEPKLKIYIAVRGEDKASAYEFVARLKTVLNKMMEAIK